VGRGDAYAAAAEDEQDSAAAASLWEKAVLDYEQALSLGDDQVKEKLEKGKATLQRIETEQEAQSTLEDLYTLLEQGNLEKAKALMRQDTYRELSASLSDSFYYFDNGSDVGLAVYPDNFYYYGQWKDGVRSGHGMWIRAAFDIDDDDESCIYEGAWANDMPNGEGTITRARYPEKIELEPGHTTSILTEIKGTFSDGLYNGTIYETWNMNDGSIHHWTPIIAANGVYQAIEEKDGYVIVAHDQISGAILRDSGDIHEIQGLVTTE